MLYPKITNIKKSRQITTLLLILSICLSIMLLIINYECSRRLNWSIVSIVGIIYTWISIIYALDKNVNLAAYTFLQMIELSILLVVIDVVFGFYKWSFNIGIPIVIMVSNFTMMIITLIRYKKYVKYAVYEILILLFSIVYNIIISTLVESSLVLNLITLWASLTNLSFILALNAKSLKIELQKKFHI